MSNNKEDFDAQVSAFKEKYPDFKPAKPIEVLNLIMTRKNAKEILEGKKKVEYRAYTDHYIGRLFDKDVLEFLKKHGEEEDVIKAQEEGIVDPLRVVKTIHFHDYNNSWYLDCDVLVNDTCIVMKKIWISFMKSMIAMTWMKCMRHWSLKRRKSVLCFSSLLLTR